MSYWKGRLRSLLSYAGKGEEKVAAVFGVTAEASHRAVLHVREGAPSVPVWLFIAVAPLPETAALCERVFQNRNSTVLILCAERELWKRWLAISVGTWTGEHGGWALKTAPFLIPPFRVLILNRGGGFFSGTLPNVFAHFSRAVRDDLQSPLGRLLGHFDEWRAQGRNLVQGLGKVAAATGLLALATALQWTSNPHRYLFRKLRGDRPLTLDTNTSDGQEAARFHHAGTEWNGEALEKLALESDARWILWLDGEENDFLGDGTVLFEDSRTFAASRQTSFRGWKTMLVPAAPFRTLQPGEASRVLAPLSSTILVDRKKLLALGVPRCSMPATAWLILFWKAAAAGWRSFSLGRDVPLREQADFPIQETAFALRVLADRSLRQLGPRQEELSRGNIAFAPGLDRMAERDSGRLRVLLVSPFLPYPLSHGGAVRMFNLCRELSHRVDFTLIAMREANDFVDYGTLHEVFREVHVVDKDERPPVDESLPTQVSASELRSLRALIVQLSRKLSPHLIQIEFTHFAPFRECAPSVPAILVEHDLTFSLYRQLAEANPSDAARREYERWLAFERKWLSVYEGVWTVSADDRKAAIEMGGRSGDRTFSIPNGVDIERYHPCEADGEVPEVFYVGSFRHLPNIIGFEKLRQEVMPRVWENAPNTRLRVVSGPEHERYWRQFGRKEELRRVDPRIEIHGFVEDLRPLYARASVVVVPLEVSAGTNIKVLEAMACGKAIVTTPVGCAGLGLRDEYHLAVRQDWGQFADAVSEILYTPELRRGLGARARQAVEESFSWPAIADQAYESYLAVAGQPVGRDWVPRSPAVNVTK